MKDGMVELLDFCTLEVFLVISLIFMEQGGYVYLNASMEALFKQVKIL
jgi:hypothetical protein